MALFLSVSITRFQLSIEAFMTFTLGEIFKSASFFFYARTTTSICFMSVSSFETWLPQTRAQRVGSTLLTRTENESSGWASKMFGCERNSVCFFVYLALCRQLSEASARWLNAPSVAAEDGNILHMAVLLEVSRSLREQWEQLIVFLKMGIVTPCSVSPVFYVSSVSSLS